MTTRRILATVAGVLMLAACGHTAPSVATNGDPPNAQVAGIARAWPAARDGICADYRTLLEVPGADQDAYDRLAVSSYERATGRLSAEARTFLVSLLHSCLD